MKIQLTTSTTPDLNPSYASRKELERDLGQRLADKLAETAILVLRSLRPDALSPELRKRETTEERRARVMAELRAITGG